MTLLNTLNVGGTDFGILNNTVMGVCVTPAGSEVKTCSFADNFELKAGVIVTIKFTYANTYGDGSTTYPKLTVNGITGAIRNVTGEYASNGAWNNQALVPFLFDGTDFTLLITNVTDTVASNNKYSVSSDAVNSATTVKTLWTGDCHTQNDMLTLSDSVANYGLLLFYVNVIPSRTPEFDIFGGIFPTTFPEYEFSLSGIMNAGGASDYALFTLMDSTHLRCDTWNINRLDSYTSGLCRILGILK